MAAAEPPVDEQTVWLRLNAFDVEGEVWPSVFKSEADARQSRAYAPLTAIVAVTVKRSWLRPTLGGAS